MYSVWAWCISVLISCKPKYLYWCSKIQSYLSPEPLFFSLVFMVFKTFIKSGSKILAEKHGTYRAFLIGSFKYSMLSFWLVASWSSVSYQWAPALSVGRHAQVAEAWFTSCRLFGSSYTTDWGEDGFNAPKEDHWRVNTMQDLSDFAWICAVTKEI